MTTIKTEASVPDDFVMPTILYKRFVESDAERERKIAESSMTNGTGDCYEASMRLKIKLTGIGGVRVRGGISSKFIVGIIDTGTIPDYLTHCWVEANGLVYDWSQGKNLIMKKEDWYRMYEIKETEIGTGTFGRFKGEDFGIKSKRELFKIDRMDCKLALNVLNSIK
jgi:hypothetical protein